MAALIVLVLFVLIAAGAVRYGVDSRDGADGRSPQPWWSAFRPIA